MKKLSLRAIIGIGFLIAIPAVLFTLLQASYQDEIDDLSAKPSPPASDSEITWDY